MGEYLWPCANCPEWDKLLHPLPHRRGTGFDAAIQMHRTVEVLDPWRGQRLTGWVALINEVACPDPDVLCLRGLAFHHAMIATGSYLEILRKTGHA
ncbi:MAG TPA: hypothetical protein VLE99_04840 [Candidatus Saccharimonadales bacterium]|nr:hypothetical protein [Candidatus Saccharimonadales bacterium]